MSLTGIKRALGQGELEIIPYRGLPIITQWNLVWLKSRNLSPVALEFLDYIRAEKERIVREVFDWYEKY